MADEVDSRNQDRKVFAQSTLASDGSEAIDGPLYAANTETSGSRATEVTLSWRNGSDGDFPSSVDRPLAPSMQPLPFSERYTLGNVLGRGGMGEVRLCRDRSIGRDVAMKVIRSRHGRSNARLELQFVREARVQGQLEHPAIVPVYDAGITPDGALYFTMKRIRGVSLSEVLRKLRDGDAVMAQRYSRRRLLTLFSQVCMAVRFSHQKGVVHRDVKPANIMFGDFGEVYLLDWGLAALRGEPTDVLSQRIDDGHSAHTLATGMAGTPGYMAPEQVEPGKVVDAAADIYALGAILFELLTLQRMNQGATAAAVLAVTLETDGASPAARAPDRNIPPELDRVCQHATRRQPGERLADAERLAQAIDAYLDGDRDLSLRRELAQAHAERAAHALNRSQMDGVAEAEERAAALREVTGALALAPDHQDARTTLLRLITEPPRVIPPEARAEIEKNRLEAYRMAGRATALRYFGYVTYIPLLLWMGVRDWGLFAVGWGCLIVCAIMSLLMLRYPPPKIDVPISHLIASTLTVGSSSLMFGPFVLLPMLAVANAVTYIASVGHRRGLVPISACLAVVIPFTLEWLGFMPRVYTFEGGTWTILPTVFYLRDVPVRVFILIGTLGSLLPVCWLVQRLRNAYVSAEERLQLQAWHLRQIFPAA